MVVTPEIAELADACAAKLDVVIVADAATLEPQFRALLEAVRSSDPRFDFDRNGRPAAVAAVREALPAAERDLMDAIVEDHACELAAVFEAMFQIAYATARRLEKRKS
jgi:hypothetical protein